MVIFYAALIGVPKDLEETAIVDGANVAQQYWNVKIPYIKPVIISNCILVLNGSLRSFDISYLLTSGGPGNGSELMSTYMYKQAFSSMKYGYGSSIAMAIVVICMTVGFAFRRIRKGRYSMSQTVKKRIFTVVKILVGALLLVIQVYPIFYVITSSMKTTDDFRQLASYALPSHFNIDNYIKRYLLPVLW